MDKIKDIIIKLAKKSPWIIIGIVLGCEIIMAITAHYETTPTIVDDYIYVISKYISDIAYTILKGLNL